uniref:uncharacterized protein LOC131138761 isoform X2 n=1 Tax=Doryrhamphus excisus TaxID=161450 RepID=UPI0025ADD200|nr:uncharacterized protein LOC131138761 isoform X2 [Doryrhamphus excisus]
MSFRWLLENDMGYTVYLIQSHQREEAAGVLVVDGHSKDSLLSFLRYALSFKEINTLLEYESLKTSVPAPAAEDDQLVGFGARASNTWREIWESRDDGYAAFILRRKCATGTKMHKLQQYLQKQQQQPSTSSTIASTCSTTTFAESTAKDEDEELEKAMLSISPDILSGSAPPTLELLRFSVQVTDYELIQPTRGGLLALQTFQKLKTLSGKPITNSLIIFVVSAQALSWGVFKQNVIVGMVKMGWSHAFSSGSSEHRREQGHTTEGLHVQKLQPAARGTLPLPGGLPTPALGISRNSPWGVTSIRTGGCSLTTPQRWPSTSASVYGQPRPWSVWSRWVRGAWNLLAPLAPPTPASTRKSTTSSAAPLTRKKSTPCWTASCPPTRTSASTPM